MLKTFNRGMSRLIEKEVIIIIIITKSKIISI